MTQIELYEFLEEKVVQYNKPIFIESDPIQIPHAFSSKEDIEIAGFLTAIISWGNRKMIIKSAHKMMLILGNTPYDFVRSHSENDLKRLEYFVHRTFNGEDFAALVRGLKHIYEKHGGLENVFTTMLSPTSLQPNIHHLKKLMFEIEHPQRTQKHISDPLNNSAAKRINMFLRWMVRYDQAGVDLGIWRNIPMAKLSCPLDVHSGNVARKLGLLTRKQNDAKALAELDQNLRTFDALDPVKYDYALFGLGVFEDF
jgi:uncharacterized protein (TIGR02757 family)